MGAFTDWVTATKRSGGIAVVWPFQTGLYGSYFGQPAARYSAADFTTAANALAFDVTLPQQSTANGAWIYVLAPSAVAADAPHSMTAGEKLANATFTVLDRGASALGLPSLAGLESFIRDGLVIAGFVLALVIVVKARGFRSVD